MPGIPALLLVLPLAGACAYSGYERARATADKTAAYREDLEHLRAQVGLTTGALRALSENPGDSPRSNRETFETYARELANLEAAGASARKTYGRMDGRAESFFGGWTTDTAEIADADLKHSAEERRAALQANYARLAEGQQGVERALAGFVDDLHDLRTYLEHDLTAAGIASARATIAKTFQNGAALEERIAAQARATDAARGSLEPLKELAPSQQPPLTGSARVR